MHGGNAALVNHHRFAGSQRYALDLIVPEDGVLPSRGVTDLARYRTYGAPLHAPVAGVVVAAEESLADRAIGDADPRNPAGNHVVLRTATGVFVLMAHLQRDSVSVAVGDEVEVGQALAKVGNSGNSSQPHLHIQAMTGPDFLDPDSRPVPLAVGTGDGAPRLLVRNDSVSGR